MISPPPGFESFDERKAVRIYQRDLPHWRQEGATYFVTFRMADSLPKQKREALKDLKRQWTRRNPPPHDPAQQRALTELLGDRVEEWLDQGYGSCALRRPEVNEVVAKAIDHFRGLRYDLFSRVIMPNHVHVLLKPYKAHPLEEILSSWKWFTARQVNAILGREGAFWQSDSFDRIVRDEEELRRTLRYIGENPGKAGLSAEMTWLWVDPAWNEAGWGFPE